MRRCRVGGSKDAAAGVSQICCFPSPDSSSLSLSLSFCFSSWQFSATVSQGSLEERITLEEEEELGHLGLHPIQRTYTAKKIGFRASFHRRCNSGSGSKISPFTVPKKKKDHPSRVMTPPAAGRRQHRAHACSKTSSKTRRPPLVLLLLPGTYATRGRGRKRKSFPGQKWREICPVTASPTPPSLPAPFTTTADSRSWSWRMSQIAASGLPDLIRHHVELFFLMPTIRNYQGGIKSVIAKNFALKKMHLFGIKPSGNTGQRSLEDSLSRSKIRHAPPPSFSLPTALPPPSLPAHFVADELLLSVLDFPLFSANQKRSQKHRCQSVRVKDYHHHM